jgi:hypothetical protein
MSIYNCEEANSFIRLKLLSEVIAFTERDINHLFDSMPFESSFFSLELNKFPRRNSTIDIETPRLEILKNIVNLTWNELGFLNHGSVVTTRFFTLQLFDCENESESDYESEEDYEPDSDYDDSEEDDNKLIDEN